MNGRKPGTSDYRDLKQNGKAARKGDVADQAGRDWWNMKGAECAESISSTIKFLQKNQQARMRQQTISARLYGNISMQGAAGATYTRLMQAQTAVKDRVTYNATQSIVDTIVARIGETKPRPFFLTSGGNYKQQRKAKKLNQFVEGVFYEQHAYDVGLEAFRDACIWGDGFVHVFGRGGRVCLERVMPSELWLDEVEGQYGAPRRLHRVKVVDRDELISVFPEKRAEIEKASKAADTVSTLTANIADMVTVAESWSLGSPDEEGEIKGGKHAIALVSGGEMLVEPEEWALPSFPFARISWCRRPVGYWSQGLCEQLQGEQLELNKELWLIQRSMHLAGTFKVLLKNGSKIVKESLNNDVGAVITYTGEPPQYVVPQPVQEVYFTNTERLIERMYRKAGISELAASSKKPAGLNSGAAIREFEDVESDRFRTVQRANDNLYLSMAELVLSVAQELSEAGKLDAVRVPNKREFGLVDFRKEIGRTKGDEFVTQCYPVSRLPKDPAGRLQTIQEYIQAGFMTPRQGRRALDFPDLDAIESLANANEECVLKTLDAIVDEGEYSPPEPTDDLQLAKELVVEYIQRYRLLDLEEERLDMLRSYSMQVDALVQAATPPAPMSAPGAPQAAPMPPPQSDLVPNVPTGAPS